MIWQLTLRSDVLPSGPVEARGLIDMIQASSSVDEVLNLPIWAGSCHVKLGDFCHVAIDSEASVNRIEMTGLFSNWNGLGFGLRAGHLMINGDTGTRTGAEITGGTIEVRGNCGSWTGAAAHGGRITIHGDTGDYLGANWPGETKGMTGGELIVHGNAGDHVGTRMRRGMIAVAGSIGAGLGRSMIAGSILAGSASIAGPVGSNMKRGTIVMKNNEPRSAQLLPGFFRSNPFRPLTLNMQLQYLVELGWKPARDMLKLQNCDRFTGDHLSLGLGEVLVLS